MRLRIGLSLLVLAAVATAAPVLVPQSGRAKGSWDLPSSPAVTALSATGKMSGILAHGATGAPAYRIEATLAFSPSVAAASSLVKQGTMKGFLYPIGLATSLAALPSHAVEGRFESTQLPVGAPFDFFVGSFSAKIHGLAPSLTSAAASSGMIEGIFQDTSIATGSFQAKWTIGG